ncbi:hypothetical protein BDV18DRAFT_78846 [Aspergillus unguis]
MSPRKALVFGATGGVGSAVARTAQSHGAQVFLALRDTSKPVPGLTFAEERRLGYERVQADLTRPETVSAAVSKTGATHAFIYATIGASPDHLLSTAEALKSSGIEQVVLLSSFGVHGDPRDIPQSDFIGYEHAQVELSVQKVFGPEKFVAIRPAFFSSNTLWWKSQIVVDGEVRWVSPDLKMDYISPEDIGAVSGKILAGALEGVYESPIVLTGPETDLTVADAIKTIGQVINKPVKVTKVSPEENIQLMISKIGMSESMAKTLTSSFSSGDDGMMSAIAPETRGNVEKYLKRPATRFAEWVEQNKDKFMA